MREHGTADVNGVRLHYVRSGSGPLMLFLHGFPEFWYQWIDQLDEFGADFLAVAPDLRGYNLSSKPERVEDYRLPLLVEDVRALAAHFGAGPHRRFTLVGHDWGGIIAWLYAAAHPDTLDRLVILNAPHPAVFDRLLRESLAQQASSSYVLLFRSPVAESALSAGDYTLLQKMMVTPLVERGAFDEEDRRAYLEAWSQPGALTGGLNYYRAAKLDWGRGWPEGVESAKDATGTLAIRVPTLVIWGERDPALRISNVEGLAEYVTDLTIRRIPDASHWVNHEKPAEVNRYIREFIGR